MKKQIYDEKNGMGYTLHGDYYLPDLVLREEEPTYGKYGGYTGALKAPVRCSGNHLSGYREALFQM